MDGINFSRLEDAIGLNENVRTLGGIIEAVLPMVWSVIGIALLAYFIFAGFQFMTSGGDPNKKAMAAGKITSALTGFLIAFSAFWIVELVGIIIGADSITSIF